MSTVLENVKDNEYGYDKRLHCKGASEIVLELCSHFIDENGNRQQLTPQKKDEIKGVINKYAKEALRTICIAYKDLKEGEGGHKHDEEEEVDGQHTFKVEQGGFTCIGILGIRDIIRPEVPNAIKECEGAGIKVRMVTGDNKVTAKAIANECNLIAEDHEYAIMEGKEFNQACGGLIELTDKNGKKTGEEKIGDFETFKQIEKYLCVLARCRPEDKYLLVTGLRQMGEVVAVTGDGTNDAPALKKADVGFAMGITGTDVAKTAADIILLDDNFASIVQACMWGRNIYDNIRRFLQFQLTVNVVALATAFIGACILTESPLQPIQLLWVNLIMDSLGSLALATEPPNRDKLLKGRKP